ncbi:3',5'-cyclic-nucleotide phosphodiesterase (PDEase) (3':5'-CNP) [Apophysomyces sp. BC1034]|nr:3',5'-cyclic-nucleotide phosphodiesterase (PDEase) (3':5'-CNP) [Apophysomyces sp. BC1021]KAG0191609.1 3',5'-cyclic-nucleotide phosphodiesterase (PDEase) (3':5'-CNP) [Apophysomyces sp. BC1034]
MSLAILNVCPDELNVSMPSTIMTIHHRRQIIKKKVVAIGRLSRTLTVLRENPELVKQFKQLSGKNILPLGTLALGEKGLRDAIASLEDPTLIKQPAMIKEQKIQTRMDNLSPTPNTKVSREQI